MLQFLDIRRSYHTDNTIEHSNLKLLLKSIFCKRILHFSCTKSKNMLIEIINSKRENVCRKKNRRRNQRKENVFSKKKEMEKKKFFYIEMYVLSSINTEH